MTDIHSKWKEVNGDETLALDWDIDRSSLVWEIGGFAGRWAAQMAEKYNPFIEIFEPQPWAVERLQERFTGNRKIEIRPFGLWVMNASLPVYSYETDGAGLLSEGVKNHVCPFEDIYVNIDPKDDIDVCLMNIEGSEFILIPYLLGNDLMQHFRYFWCQFHLFVPQSVERMNTIYQKMETTHRVRWDYFPTAVCWERR